MDRLAHQAPEEVARTREHELQIVHEAIALVASGVSRRVVVAGLALSHQLLNPARRLAAEAGVRLAPLRRADEDGVDIAIEWDSDDST